MLRVNSSRCVICFVCALAVGLAAPLPKASSSEPSVASEDPDLRAHIEAFADDAAFADNDLSVDVANETIGRRMETSKEPTLEAPKSSKQALAALRYKLSQSYCPTADATEKQLLACKNLELKNKIKKASDDAEKKRLGDERKALYTAAVAKSDGEKKATAMAHKLLFSKAWRTHCGAHTTDAMCSNETMKKLYGGAAHKAGAKPKGASGASGAKKSKKKKA